MAASQKQQLMFFRAPDGRVFVDNIGSQIAREGAGEVELINAMNIRRVIASRPIPPTGGPLPDDTSLASTVPGALAAPIPTTVFRNFRFSACLPGNFRISNSEMPRNVTQNP